MLDIFNHEIITSTAKLAEAAKSAALQLLRLKNQSSREQDVIERQVRTLMRLVDDLLDVSRITLGKIELRKERVELAEAAARAIEMASPLFEQKRQMLAVHIPPRGLVVDGDPARLAQVFANLLTNAAKYTTPIRTSSLPPSVPRVRCAFA